MWTKITKSSGKSWDKTVKHTPQYKQFSILQENGSKLLQENGYQLSTQDAEVLNEIWDFVTKSVGKSWDKFSRPDYSPVYQQFNLLLEDGHKILQEDGFSLIKVELVNQLWDKITKSTGKIWNKIT